jgi:hypothetical protein
MEQLVALTQSGRGEPWNKGKLVGQKAPLRLKDILGDPHSSPTRGANARTCVV